MLRPRYIFAGEFSDFLPYFLSQPHREKTFRAGEKPWALGEPFRRIHYILSGAEMHSAWHENGRRKILSFHGAGTMFPVWRPEDFKIEMALETVALSDMRVLEFTKDEFRRMFEGNPALATRVVYWYSMYINRLLFETVHQEYNPAFVKLCNLLHLLMASSLPGEGQEIAMTQDDLAELLGTSRIQTARGLAELRRRGIIVTSRKRVEVTDAKALAALCTEETI